jgi:hypothetical protein
MVYRLECYGYQGLGTRRYIYYRDPGSNRYTSYEIYSYIYRGDHGHAGIGYTGIRHAIPGSNN